MCLTPQHGKRAAYLPPRSSSGVDYSWSLKLLERFKEAHPKIPTKSGLMVEAGEGNAGNREGYARLTPSRRYQYDAWSYLQQAAITCR